MLGTERQATGPEVSLPRSCRLRHRARNRNPALLRKSNHRNPPTSERKPRRVTKLVRSFRSGTLATAERGTASWCHARNKRTLRRRCRRRRIEWRVQQWQARRISRERSPDRLRNASLRRLTEQAGIGEHVRRNLRPSRNARCTHLPRTARHLRMRRIARDTVTQSSRRQAQKSPRRSERADGTAAAHRRSRRRQGSHRTACTIRRSCMDDRNSARPRRG